MTWNVVPKSNNTWDDKSLTSNSWQQNSNADNTWNELNNNINVYVVSGYWIDGYTVDTVSSWTEIQQSQNTWIVIG